MLPRPHAFKLLKQPHLLFQHGSCLDALSLKLDPVAYSGMLIAKVTSFKDMSFESLIVREPSFLVRHIPVVLKL